MINQHLFFVQGLSDSELSNILYNPGSHDPEVVQAALEEIQNRKMLQETDDPKYDQTDHVISSEGEEEKYAGLISRFFAYTIDVIIMIFPTMLVQVAIVGPELHASQGKLSIISFLVLGIYYVIMEGGKNQATLGKKALGLKVVSADDRPITYSQAALRYFTMLISVFPLCAGIISIAATKHNQAWHDMIAGCYVVRNS